MTDNKVDTLDDLVLRVHTASLATLDSSGTACCSYAPYVYSHGRFYLFLSGLAAHCRNVQLNANCELMLIEDESSTKNLFARRRAMIRCVASTVNRGSAEFAEVTALFRSKFGPTLDMLVSLPDFTLFSLQPLAGTIVLGFGNALPIQFREAKIG